MATQEALILQAQAKRELQLMEAREDAAAFIEYAIPHERTGRKVKNADFHREWHQLARDHKQMVVMASVEHAKTQHIAVGGALHALGTDPSLRVAIVANSGTQSGKTLSSLRRHIEDNPLVRDVFPDLKPSERDQDPWHNTALTVNRTTFSKDPSVQAVGVQGRLLGSRLDLIIVDDVLDFENTRTPEMIQKTVDWFDSTVLSRLTDEGRVWVIGTPWHPEDLLHILARRPGWHMRKYGAVLNPKDSPDKWIPRWPAQFSQKRLRKIHAGMTPLNFARSYLCEARTDEASRFDEAWIDDALKAGRGLHFVKRRPLDVNGRPMPCFTGVDLSVGKKSTSDLSSIFTVGIDHRNRRRVCEIQSGRWTAPDVLAKLKSVYERFGSIVVVEDNAAQSFLIQWATGMGIPVRPYTTTGKAKYNEHFGVESIAVELRAGQWVIPSGAGGQEIHHEAQAWIREMLFYSPDSHTGDRLMASWFAREAIRTYSKGLSTRMDTLSR
jgi:hypothetical protein